MKTAKEMRPVRLDCSADNYWACATESLAVRAIVVGPRGHRSRHNILPPRRHYRRHWFGKNCHVVIVLDCRVAIGANIEYWHCSHHYSFRWHRAQHSRDPPDCNATPLALYCRVDKSRHKEPLWWLASRELRRIPILK